MRFEHELADEILLLVFPVLLGTGKRKTVRPVGRDVFRRRVYSVRQQAFRGGRPKAAPDIVGSATQQQIEIVAVRRDDGLFSSGIVMWRRPSAVAVVVFLRALNHAVQRDIFDDSG